MGVRVARKEREESYGTLTESKVYVYDVVLRSSGDNRLKRKGPSRDCRGSRSEVGGIQWMSGSKGWMRRETCYRAQSLPEDPLAEKRSRGSHGKTLRKGWGRSSSYLVKK